MTTSQRDPREIMREEPLMRPQILSLVGREPRSVPELARLVGAPTYEMLLWVMAMRRYGYLREVKGSADDGYFRYEPAGREAR